MGIRSRLTLDPSSFETLLLAAWVLQCHHEQEVRNRQSASDETPVELPETHVEPLCASEFNTRSIRILPALNELSEAAEAGVNQNTPLASPTTLNRIEQVRNLNVDPWRVRSWFATRLSRGRRQAVLLLLHVAESARNRLESFARHETKVKVTVTLSSLRPMAAAGIIMVALMLFQGWHHVHVAAATSRMDQQSEQNSVRRVGPFRPVPRVQVSHMQVSDRAVLPVVQALSRYEIRGLRRQADYGDDSAAFVMGMVYETGRHVPQSCTKAAEWVARSANEGNAAAQYNLGLRYREGDGVPANEDEAEKWLRKAANQRYSNAKLALKTLPTDQKPIP